MYTTLTFDVETYIKLAYLADVLHRSKIGQVRQMIDEDCKKHGVKLTADVRQRYLEELGFKAKAKVA
ncbi:MAG: hypothetical protein QXJ74_05295 [Nitrososphaera sp.]